MSETQRCEYEGCDRPGIPCYLLDDEPDRPSYYQGIFIDCCHINTFAFSCLRPDHPLRSERKRILVCRFISLPRLVAQT